MSPDVAPGPLGDAVTLSENSCSFRPDGGAAGEEFCRVLANPLLPILLAVFITEAFLERSPAYPPACCAPCFLAIIVKSSGFDVGCLVLQSLKRLRVDP